ncbi:alpha/beta hydrolase [Fimbriiglobus ruber]|uniref:Acetyl esterase n=1 Tax=Fimbriiglobus ruber TaxID=1908690 RepID=A0A225D415_9BACT|nr:alpha/beta hydrolase [Fimbriiglobus ruber]OWK34384.1 Acetyl esterase [Fimbriiglobus ruber]
MHRFTLAMVACLLAIPLSFAAEPTMVLDLWPGVAPGEKGDVGPEEDVPAKPGQRPVRRIGKISKPLLSVFKPAKDKDTGAAIVIAPGGGYSILAWDLEGEEVAAWLNSIGVTGIVLKYRVPRRASQPKDAPPIGALQDAQRALSLVRSKADSLGIDPKRVGMLGFSAGGHLTAWTATNPDKRAYDPVDEADKQSCRPDFVVLVYPAYLTDKKKPDQLAEEIRVSKDTPPCFFAHAYDDGVSPENSVRMFLELKKLKVPAELHVYSTGGHGFGLRKEGKPCATWPDRCAEWLATQGITTKK